MVRILRSVFLILLLMATTSLVLAQSAGLILNLTAGDSADITCTGADLSIQTLDKQHVQIRCVDTPSPSPVASGTPMPLPPQPIQFRPNRIPITADEIPNPNRGLYRWIGQTYICPPQLISNRESYRRVNWSAVEPSKGRYDWSRVEKELAEAAERNQRVWIGFAVSAGPPKYGPYVPSYMVRDGWGEWFEGDWYPNYNHPAVQERLEALLDSFQRTFGDDSRIVGLQMLSYGRFGEGYLPWNADRTRKMWASEDTAKWMIDAWHMRFSSRFQLSIPLSNNYVFKYAMTKEPKWGWSRMALGWGPQMQNIDRLMADQSVIAGVEIGEAVQERWKYAPVLTEMIGDYGSHAFRNQFKDAVAQVSRYHVSLVSNGNFKEPYHSPPWNFRQDCSSNPDSDWSRADIDDFVMAGKLAGYRYAISTLSMSKPVPGTTLSVTTAWENEGVAPVYEPWRVRFDFRHVSDGDLAWSGVSRVDLRTILPTEGKPVKFTDTFVLPASLPPGEYRLHVYIPPLNDVVDSLNLANEGRNSGGGYELGNFMVAVP